MDKLIKRKAKIEIRVRDVKNTLGMVQHLFIIHTDSQELETIISGGPTGNNVLTGDIEITKRIYVKDLDEDWLKNAPREIIATGSDAEIQSIVDKMWIRAQDINKEKYDYKIPTTSFSHVQNSNTVVADLVKIVDLEMKIPNPPSGKPSYVPGAFSEFTHTTADKVIRDITEITAANEPHIKEETSITKKVESVLLNTPAIEEQINKLFQYLDASEMQKEGINNLERFEILEEKARSEGDNGFAEIFVHLAGEHKRVFDFLDNDEQQENL